MQNGPASNAQGDVGVHASGDAYRLPQSPRYRASARVIAVTGACSFIGAELIKRLEADPRCVRVLAVDVRKPAFPLRKTQYHSIDLTVPTADADLADIFRREGVDTVVHAAFLSSPTHNSAWAHELESIGTMHVLSAAGEAHAHKLVMLSTTLIYGASPANPNYLTEQHEPKGQPRSRFVNDKLDAERQAHRFAHENPHAVVTILRAAPTLGPRIRNFVTQFFARPIVPVLMGYDPLVQFVHEDDLVDACVLAVEHDHPGTYNVVGDGVLPYSTILAMMGKVPLPLPSFVAYPASRTLWVAQVSDMPPHFLDFLRFLCVADGVRARDELGFRPRYGIQATVRDFLGLEATPPEPARIQAHAGTGVP